MYCPGGNATDPIWRVLAFSQGISSWTPFKHQHSNPNPNPLANQLWCVDFLTPSTPLIIPHRLPAFLESLMPLKNWCSIHARWSKSSFMCVLSIKVPIRKKSLKTYLMILISRLRQSQSSRLAKRPWGLLPNCSVRFKKVVIVSCSVEFDSH